MKKIKFEKKKPSKYEQQQQHLCLCVHLQNRVYRRSVLQNCFFFLSQNVQITIYPRIKDFKKPTKTLLAPKKQTPPAPQPPPPPSIPRRLSYICPPTDFKCSSHQHTCIKASRVCDGIYDCLDHSDEFNCTRDMKTASVPMFKRWKKHDDGHQKQQQQHQLKKRQWRRNHPNSALQRTRKFIKNIGSF